MGEAGRRDLVAVVPRSCTAQSRGKVLRCTGDTPNSASTLTASLIEVGSTSRARTNWKNAASSITSNPTASKRP